jgi:hypothetical protein
MSGNGHAVEDVLDELRRTAGEKKKVSVADAVAALDARGYGPFLFVPALVEISPIGGIPGVPTFLALIIVIIAGQIAWGREHLWLPGFICRRSVSDDRMKEALEKLAPFARWLDRWFHERLAMLTRPAALRVAAAVIVLLCLGVPLLELVPFASTAPMAAIAMFGLAFTLRDGLLMALAYILSAVAVAVGFGLVAGGGGG